MRRRTKSTERLIRRGAGAAGACIAAAGALPALAADATAEASPNDVAPVVVTARKPGVTALSEKIQDTAQSINVVPQAEMQQQAVTNLQDALKEVPGVTLNAGEGGAHGDTINLRGFPASDDFFLDGLRDTGFYTRDSFDLENLEVYKGPASTLFGRGSTGGVVNQVSKTPALRPIEDAVLTLGTSDEVRGTADVNGTLSDTAAWRIDLMGQRSSVADRDYVRNRRWGVAPSIAFGIGGPTSLTVNYLYQAQDDIPDYGIPFVGDAPAPVPRNLFYGLAVDDRFKTQVDIGTVRFTHAFSNAVSINENLRIGNYWLSSRITAPHYDPSGLIPPPTAATPLDQIQVYRDRPSVDGTVFTVMSDTELTVRFDTGALRHTLVAGMDIDRESADLTRFANQISSGLTVAPGEVGPTPLLDPDPFEAFPGRQTAVSSRPDTVTETLAGFLVDSVDIGAHWNLVGAIRLDRFHARFDEPISGLVYDHTDLIASPKAALVYKPTETASLYLSYGTSFDPSAENLSLAPANASLGVEKDHTFEAGAKAVVLDGKLSLTGAVFDTEISNARVADPDNPQLQTLAGNLRVRGAELGAQGYVADHWEVIAGYTWLDGVTVASTDPAQVGKPLQNTARNQANLWTVYDFPNRIKIGTGLNYLGERPTDMLGQVHIPAQLTWDAMIGYRLNGHVAVQVNAYNLTGALYYTSAYYTGADENHVVPGPGRTVALTLTFSQ